MKGLEQQLEEAQECIAAYENKLEGMAGSKQALKVSSLALMRGALMRGLARPGLPVQVGSMHASTGTGRLLVQAMPPMWA
jgi:hypothetical protein